MVVILFFLTAKQTYSIPPFSVTQFATFARLCNIFYHLESSILFSFSFDFQLVTIEISIISNVTQVIDQLPNV